MTQVIWLLLTTKIDFETLRGFKLSIQNSVSTVIMYSTLINIQLTNNNYF